MTVYNYTCCDSFNSSNRNPNQTSLSNKENLLIHITKKCKDVWLQAWLDPAAQTLQ